MIIDKKIEELEAKIQELKFEREKEKQAALLKSKVHHQRINLDPEMTLYGAYGNGIIEELHSDDIECTLYFRQGRLFETKKEAELFLDKERLIHELWQEDGVATREQVNDQKVIKFCPRYRLDKKKWENYFKYVEIYDFALPVFTSEEAVNNVIKKYGDRLNILLEI